MEAFRLLARTEGIVPAIESAHALAGALTLGARLPARTDGQPPLILVSLSGRGDKDVDTAIKWFDLDTSGTGSESGTIDAAAPSAGRAGAGRPVDGGRRRAVSSDLGHTGPRFAEVRASGRGALVGFLHVGYPDVADLAGAPSGR